MTAELVGAEPIQADMVIPTASRQITAATYPSRLGLWQLLFEQRLGIDEDD